MSTVKPVKVALIGSGNISYTYLNTLVKGGFNIIDVVGCSDLIPERSKARAELFGIRQMTNEEILNDPEIEIVINTTQLWNHTAVTRQILEAGKNVYSEKAMGDTLEGAKANYELAASKGLRLGCAPDCYMGAAFQTARKLLDDGAIGRPLIAHAMCYRGYNSHYAASDPADPSAGSAGDDHPRHGRLLHQRPRQHARRGQPRFRLHEVLRRARVREPAPSALQGAPCARNRRQAPRRHRDARRARVQERVLRQPDLLLRGLLPEVPKMEIYGTEGILTLPDPNNFGGWGNDVYLTRVGNTVNGKNEVFRVPFTHGFGDTDPSIPTLSGKREPCYNSWRGLAVVDMAYAIRRGRPHRSSAELALHTVEIIDAIEHSMKDNKVYTLQSCPERPHR